MCIFYAIPLFFLKILGKFSLVKLTKVTILSFILPHILKILRLKPHEHRKR